MKDNKQKNVIEEIQEKFIENMNNERMVNMNIQMLNAVSGTIMSPMIDKLCKKVTVDEVQNLYTALESMCENDLKEEAFYVLHAVIKISGVRLPEEYRCIIDNEKLRDDFVEEAIADLEDILNDLE